MKKLLTILLLPLSTINFAQQQTTPYNLNVGRSCGTMDVHDQMLQNDPNYKLNRKAIEKHYQHQLQNTNNKAQPPVYTIPVVFHVIHEGEPVGTGRNLSDAQLLSQIAVLNEDFRATNSDFSNVPSVFSSVAVDAEINFCLAVRDPNGVPTTGIVRHNMAGTWTTSTNPTTVQNSFDSNVKPTTIWDRDSYLNIWTADMSNSGLLGYAQFPGGAANTDGVVILHTSVGNTGNVNTPYDLGRTATHEIGHWLDLLHVHQGGCSGLSSTNCTTGGDRVCDTPQSANATFGCPGSVNTCTETPVNQVDMTMNYMSYVDDACMYMFSAGQKTRMQAVMTGSRSSLQTSQGCMPATVAPVANFEADHIYISPGTTINFTDLSTNFPTSWNWSFDIANAGGVSPLTSTIQNPSATYNNLGTYNVQMIATNQYGIDTVTKSTYIHVINCQDVSVDIQMDNFASTVSWEIISDSTNLVVLQGSGYSNVTGGQLINDEVCLTDGCYTFKIYDAGGNGICCVSGNGSYTITNNAINTILGTGGQFTFEDSIQFCISTATSAPIASFTSSNTTICQTNDIQFFDQSTNTASAWAWSFPGGVPSTSTLRNPIVNYPSSGSFPVTLVAYNNVGSDSITMTSFIQVNSGPVANAGSDLSFCANNVGTINLNGSVTVASGGNWTTSGNGTFSNQNNLTSTYTPSNTDITSGSTTITLSSVGNGSCAPSTDNLIITYTPEPIVNAGIDETICENDSVINLNATITGATGGIWTGGNGSFQNDTMNTTNYYVNAGDISAGVTLTLTSTGNGDCNAVSDAITFSFQTPPTVDAGLDQTLCSGNNFILDGSFAEANGVIWSSSGSGNFSPIASIKNPIYVPSNGDVTNGTVTLTLSTTGNGVCDASVDTLMLILENCTSIDNLHADSKITIYPNPARANIFISTEEIKILGIDIISILGAHIKSFDVRNINDISLPVSDLESGIYTLTLKTKEKNINKIITINR